MTVAWGVPAASSAGGGGTSAPASGIGAISRILLPADVTNSTVTLADITGLAFAMAANAVYAYKFVIDFTADLGTTGSRWGVTGASAITRAITKVEWTIAAGSDQVWTQVDGSINVNASANSVVGTGNIVIMEGVVKNAGAANTWKAQFASEVASVPGIIAKAGLTYVESVQLA